MAEQFDVVVIGAGPGGYIAAIRAAQLGFRTACIDDWTRAGGKPAPGGTCTNVGCIPSKALLQSSENYEHVGHAFAEHGIEVKGVAIDVARMLARKDKVVGQNNDGILYLFKKNKIAFFHGKGSFAGGDATAGWMVQVNGERSAELTARHVIVATGSKPRPLPGVAIDNERVLDNEGALALAEVPARLGVVGAGVIGLEMGSVWRRLGAKVTVLEALPAFLGAADEAVAKEAQKVFAKQGLVVKLGVNIAKVTLGKNDVAVEWTDAAGKVEVVGVRSAHRVDRTRAAHGGPQCRGSRTRLGRARLRRCRSTIAGPTSPTCGRSATSCAARCSRTRPRTKAWRSPSALPASTGTSISTPSPGSSTPRRRSPGSARPSSS